MRERCESALLVCILILCIVIAGMDKAYGGYFVDDEIMSKKIFINDENIDGIGILKSKESSKFDNLWDCTAFGYLENGNSSLSVKIMIVDYSKLESTYRKMMTPSQDQGKLNRVELTGMEPGTIIDSSKVHRDAVAYQLVARWENCIVVIGWYRNSRLLDDGTRVWDEITEEERQLTRSLLRRYLGRLVKAVRARPELRGTTANP